MEDRPTVPVVGRVWSLLVEAGKEYGADHSGRLAAALAYYTLFSMVPLLLVAVALTAISLGPPAGTLPEDCSQAVDAPLSADRPLDQLVVQIQDVAGSTVADPIRVLICEARQSAGASLGIGLALAAYSASGIFLQVRGALNAIFHVGEEAVSGLLGWLRRRGLALVSALILAVLVFVPVVAVGSVQFLGSLIPDRVAGMRSVLASLVPVTSLVMLVLVVSGTFRVLPAVRIPWRAAWRGGLFTSLVGLGSAFGVGTYLGRVAHRGTFGAVGGLAVLLFFAYLMWVVYVFGAEVTKVYAERLDGTSREPPPAADSGVDPTGGDGGGRSAVFGFLVGFLLGRYRRR